MDHRLLLVHAHPDDETINNGATMAKYVAEGRQVTCVTCTLGEEGEVITLDGSEGKVYGEALDLIPPQINEDFLNVVQWADGVRRLGVRANADNFEDASKARELGAEGIGLCRTEHMFMAQDRLPAVRRMILAETEEDRAAALEEILPMQQEDFEAIFDAMSGLPVTVLLLDPPMHEFLPNLVDQALLVQRLEIEGRGDDERESRRHIDETGEPDRDALGNQDGAS